MTSRPARWLPLFLLLIVACSSSSADAPADGGAAEGGSKGRPGTPPPDGAPGRCCPASVGGCAFSGGYQATDLCPERPDTCDNMCEQKIVKDEHGCDKLTYKSPPVTTTYASDEPCTDPKFNGGGFGRPDAGSDAGKDAGDGGDGGV